jgi:hypothetical protein
MFEDLDPPELRMWAVMRNFVADFFYYLRRGYGIRKSWRMATITL